ncbi:MAG: ATP-dependent sacrificial sulfur transferase LarE [Phycisphaeraceae bacterium]
MSTTATTSDAQTKLDRLLAVLRPRERVLTAFSGGVDSTLVAAAARRALGRANAPAVVGDSPSLPRRELEEARQLARELDLELIEVTPGEQADPGYQANAGDRCYFCKTHLYDALHALAREQGYRWIANGTNVDDLGDHRPGLRAADEAQVISPLLDAGLTKQDVRDVAALLDLPNADKPAAACLASRIPYGTPVTPERLAAVEQAEAALHALGFAGFRVRHHEQVARLELPWDQVARLMDDVMREQVIAAIKAAGFQFAALDLEGFRSGSGNVLLTVSK